MSKASAVAVAGILTLVVVLMAPGEARMPDPTCVPQYVPDVGLACPSANGTYTMFDPNTGEYAGTTHGPDLVRPGGEDEGTHQSTYTFTDPVLGFRFVVDDCAGNDPLMPTMQPSNPPTTFVTSNACPEEPPEAPDELRPRNIHCVDGEPGEYHIKIIYARSYDDAATPGFNGFALRDDEVVDMFRMANEQIDTSALYNGDHADLKVQCDMGRAKVHRHIVWQPIDAVDFGTIRAELMTRPEFNEPEVKYWVYWDDTRGCGCLGQGQRADDPTKAVSNLNNGNWIPTYAVTFGRAPGAWTTILHEGGHTLGAVQDRGGVNGWNSPPHATLGGHCYDSADIMCQDDQAPNGSLFGSFENCEFLEWDCDLDDYFNTDPDPSNYLFHHWNIGDPMVRYIARDASTMDDLICPEDAFVGQTIICAFRGGNPGAEGVEYRVEWGDGTPDSTSGPHDPKGMGTATHTYTSHGWYRIHVYAQDDGGWPNESGGMPWTIQVHEVPEGDCVAGAQNQDTRDCPVDITNG